MNKNSTLILVGGIIMGALATVAITSSALNNQNYKIAGMGQEPDMVNNVDRHFIEQMIPHHEDAIAMANIALQKADHPEVKELARNIIKTQTAEINQMRQWYKSWFGQDVSDTHTGMGHTMGSGTMHMGMTGNTGDTENLQSANPFDKAFIEKMIPHHQMAVMMGQMLKNSTRRPEMRGLANGIITAQNKEIEQMKIWYGQWY